MPREQMIDAAVRRVCIRAGMKRPFQFLRGISNRARAVESFRAGLPSELAPELAREIYGVDYYYVAPGGNGQTYNTQKWAGKSVAEVALDMSTPWSGNRYIDRIRAEFSRAAKAKRRASGGI